MNWFSWLHVIETISLTVLLIETVSLTVLLIDDDGDGAIDEDCYIIPAQYTYYCVFMQNQVEPIETGFPMRLYGASYHNQAVRIQTPKYYFNGTYT